MICQKTAVFFGSLACVILFITAPAASEQRRSGPVRDLESLIRSLRANGASVRRAGRISQPFFSVRGRVITVGGEKVQVFQYTRAEDAERESGRVSQTGASVGTSMMSWMAPPHFYKAGRLIVLYVGSDTSTTRVLERALGPQFAGR